MAKRIVIDLEMCMVQKIYRSKQFPCATEIIQIGAVMLDDTNEITNTFCSYVKPEHGAINNYIRKLTGICSKDVKPASPLGEVIQRMCDWIGDQEVTFISWSDTDYHQLKKELQLKGVNIKEVTLLSDPCNWIDYQKVFEARFQLGRILSLRDALFFVELDPDGRLHDGLSDAVNTARLIATLERNPEKMFLADRIRKQEHEAEHFGTSMGQLLKGFNLQIA